MLTGSKLLLAALALSPTISWAEQSEGISGGINPAVGGISPSLGKPPSAPTSTWSVVDATANALTLSNGNLTVAQPAGGTWQSIRSSTSKTSGKLYAEFSVGTYAGTQSVLFGLASSGFAVSSYLGSNPYSGGIRPQPVAGTYVSTGFSYVDIGSPATVETNVTISLAVDFTGGNVWLAWNNVWDGTPTPGNPAAGTLPKMNFVPATVGPLFLAMSLTDGSAGGVWTFQPTAASQKYAPPAGFTPWN